VRYGDGIIGVSFNSSFVIRFDRAELGTESNLNKDIGGFQDKSAMGFAFTGEEYVLSFFTGRHGRIGPME
jgi:hypothetical protein